jgi:hypothetical protein
MDQLLLRTADEMAAAVHEQVDAVAAEVLQQRWNLSSSN